MRVQESREEMVLGLDTLLQTRIQAWACYNRDVYPENIIVYRDDVSERQYDMVLDNELLRIKKAYRNVYPATGLPRILAVPNHMTQCQCFSTVCQKCRHSFGRWLLKSCRSHFNWHPPALPWLNLESFQVGARRYRENQLILIKYRVNISQI